MTARTRGEVIDNSWLSLLERSTQIICALHGRPRPPRRLPQIWCSTATRWPTAGRTRTPSGVVVRGFTAPNDSGRSHWSTVCHRLRLRR
jgi:hypothetical protein